MAKRRDRRAVSRKASPGLSPRSAEQLLIDAVGEFPATRVFCTSLGRAQLARSYAERFPDSQAMCLFLDISQARRAEIFDEPLPANLQILCDTDPPEEEFDLVLMPLTQGGDAELMRDLMQAAHQQLQFGGQMVVGIDNVKDTWLHKEMQSLFAKVTRRAAKGGVIYVGTKREPIKKLKNFRSEFKFRDGETLIRVVTRPGVFSHRRLDTGARALMEAMTITPGDRVLDLGCGAGVLSLAAALRAPNVKVLAIDSHARAVGCTKESAALGGIETIATKLNANAKVDEEQLGTFDVALANPPYFSNHRIAEVFLKGAFRALKPGGEMLIVAKNSEWYEENMPRRFRNVTVENSRGYFVIRGQKPDARRGSR